MSKLKIVITSGGTREYVDDVRVLTNISSGRLGAKIADKFLQHGHEVTYVSSKNAITPASCFTGQYGHRPIGDTGSVMEVMKELVPQSHVVIQAMAVSDFTFDLKEAIKISSEDPEAFIEHMRRTIRITPKIISYFRDWNEKAILVGFKFTVGKTKKELSSIAEKLMEDNRLDMVFANDKTQMQKEHEHVGMLIKKDFTGKFERRHVRNKEEIVEVIYSNVMMTRRFERADLPETPVKE